jgi:hypothetical protein
MAHADNALVDLKKVVASVVWWHRLEVLLQKRGPIAKEGSPR